MSDFTSTDVSQWGGVTRSSDEDAVMAMERRGCVILLSAIANR